MSDTNADLALIHKTCEALHEHFESVQIFVTKEVDEMDREAGPGTANIASGKGNWFARYGQVRAWLVQEDERARQEATE